MSENQKNFNINELEQEVLKFWQENKTFEKSLSKSYKVKPKTFVFFDGPPFANGLPHYGHILASIIKDAIPRYKTMKGYRAPRKWGWDCHGLPVEYEIEKELDLKDKKAIEKFGVENFNEKAKESVLRYADEWKKIIPRIGRWVDMENAYKTMDWYYTESIWWIFKTLYDKGLIYLGYKPMHLCPRCETTLANFEVAQGYKDITDISVYVKFKVKSGQPVGNRMSSDKTYLLAWTTTPWTLPGNVVLAVGKDIEYAETEKDGESLLYAENSPLAKELGFIRKGIKGQELIGLEYEPLFNDYENWKDYSKFKNGWKIYPADFVTTEEGTGIVHIAPAFGEDDMNLAKKYDLPFIQHVGIDGRFKSDIHGGVDGEFKTNFEGLFVKPKDDHQKTDIEIIKWLAANNKLFKKQKITHAYPHCWRCDTPLLNYASASWFVKVLAIKDKLIGNNKKIKWIPEHLKEGRFGKWLEGSRDWAISRTRYWGAPLPVWRCDKCEKIEVVGSLDELKKHAKKSNNKYFAMRHGEAVHNVKNKVSSKLETNHNSPLTEKGKKEVEKAAEKLKNIDIIFASDFLRTKQTAEITAKALGYAQNKIIFDERIREVNTGIFDSKTPKEYHNYFSSLEEKFYKNPPDGENLTELKNRAAEFLYEIENKYSGKNILIISHEYTIWLMFGAAIGADVKKSARMKQEKGDDFIKTAELLELDFIPIPHNKNYEIDLHKPYIDEINLQCDCGNKLKRVADVFDCWFESGAMPYGQAHYPFENKKEFEKNFPAEFIAEGLDQTRGWFYTLLVLSTALFNKPAYKNVIVNGIILAEDGQKMSKRLKNYPDPIEVVNKYGADALRLYLLSSRVVRAEDLNFSEKGVDEVYKKVILRLWNVYKFYELYANKKMSDVKGQMSNVLDRWIIARLNQLIQEISEAMENYELDKASQPIFDFIDDLSTWYIRRSRQRFKEESEDKQNAIATTRYVLSEFSKIIAPFMPFISEAIYSLTNKGKESVHLKEWPQISSQYQVESSKVLLGQMKEVRKICSLGLEARQKAGIKVRQPITSLKIKNQKSKIKNNEEFLALIKDEINVKEIIFDDKIIDEVELDIKITPELKIEGHLRELIRIIQDLRKEAGYTPKDKVALYIEADDYFKRLIINSMENLKRDIGAKTIEFAKTEKFDAKIETKIDDSKIWIGIKKI